MCVEDGVGVGQFNGVTVFVPFTGSDAALYQSSPTRDGNLCADVAVPHLWGHLKVAMVRVKVVVMVIKVISGIRSSAGKSCSIALGPRWWAMLSLNTLRISWWIGQCTSWSLRCRRVDLQTVCPREEVVAKQLLMVNPS
jgi:hypothetical protein